MKKIFSILAIALCITFAYAPLNGQNPEGPAATEASGEAIAPTPIPVPDTACIVLNGEQICIVAKDAKEAAAIISQFVKTNSGAWPKSLGGWLTLFASFLFSASGTALLVNIRRFYNFLRPFLKKTLHIVALVAMAFSYGSTYLIGLITKDGFNPSVFAVLSMLSSFGAVYIYETWIKKKDPLPIPKPQTPAP